MHYSRMMRYVLPISMACSSSIAYANVLQYFTGLSYNNPAELFKTAQTDLILGATSFYANVGFTGSALNLNTMRYDHGANYSKRVSLLPYGRIAHRASKRLVLGVDVTEPFHSNLRWGKKAFTRYASIETLMTDVDVSPRFSFQVNPALFIGAGLNFNFLKNNETNWALPISQTEYAMLLNRTIGFGVGYDAGFYLMVDQKNFVGAVYYSTIPQNTRGESRFNGTINNNIAFNFHMPPTTVMSYTHLFSQTWLISAQAFRSEWGINQYARIQHTAAPPPFSPDFVFAMKYHTSWAYSAVVRHQFSPKTGLTLIGVMDNGPEQNRLRTINFPSDTQYFLALAADYQVNKISNLQLLYGRGISHTSIQNQIALGPVPQPFNTGRVNIHADLVDLRLTIKM